MRAWHNYCCLEYTYEDMGSKPQQGNTDNHKTLEKGNFETENQVYEIDRLATPGDYGNEALYEEMTARYYVRIPSFVFCTYATSLVYVMALIFHLHIATKQ